MATWYITCVRKDDRGTIRQVGIGPTRLGDVRSLKDKSEVAEKYFGGSNRVFVPGRGPNGADVEVHVVDKPGGPYLRTDADKTPADNLGNLPAC